jgi:protein gp37
MLAWTRAHFCSGRSRKDGKATWPQNVWLGVSVENQSYTWRIEHLQRTPATIKFLSIEPLLSSISMEAVLLEAIQWIIVGGESGPRARPMRPEWVCEIRNQCEKYRVPFFFKQWGAYDPMGRRVGKKKAGRTLDGRTWEEIPTSLSQ